MWSMKECFHHGLKRASGQCNRGVLSHIEAATIYRASARGRREGGGGGCVGRRGGGCQEGGGRGGGGGGGGGGGEGREEGRGGREGGVQTSHKFLYTGIGSQQRSPSRHPCSYSTQV